MAAESPPRSRKARAAAEAALLRIVRNCGRQPEFVVLGGLVPELLCTASSFRHAGTTDIDVQINLEIVCGAANATVLEKALRGAGFAPEAGRPWRWIADGAPDQAGIKFEMLADLDNEPASSTILFDACDSLGAANLRGTGFAARDFEVRELSARIEGVDCRADVRVAGLAGFLLAKVAAAYSRRGGKDWYDIAFVLLNNDMGGPKAAAELVRDRFASELGTIQTALRELQANFDTLNSQGSQAFSQQMQHDHPDLDPSKFAETAMLAVQEFYRGLQLEAN